MARQLDEAKQKSAELTDTLGDLKAEIKNMADDELNMKAFEQGIGLVRDGLSAAVSVAALFGAEEKKLEAVVTKVTAVMTTANTVIGIFNALHKESYLRIVANRLSMTLLNGAMSLYTKVTGQATVATGALGVAQKALPIMTIVGVLTAIVSALYAYVSASEDAKDAENKQAEALKKAREKQIEYAREVGRSAGQMVVSYNKLKKEYSELKTQAQKTEWIQKNASEFSKLGLKIKNVNDAEKIFTGNTGQVVRSLQMRAQAMALEQKMLKAYEDYYAKDEEISTSKSIRVWHKGDEVDDATAKAAGVRTKSQRKQIDLARGVEPDAQDVKSITKEYADLTQKEIDKVNAYEAKKGHELNEKKRAENKKTLDQQIAYITKKTEELKKKIPGNLQGNFQLTGEPDNSTTKTTTSSSNKETEKAKTELEKLREQLKKLQEDRNKGFDSTPVVEFDAKVRALKKTIADKEFQLTLDANPAEASIEALYQKMETLNKYLSTNIGNVTDEMAQRISDVQNKISREIDRRDFSKRGTSMPNWRNKATNDDLKQRQEALRSQLRERIPDNPQRNIQTQIDEVKAKIKVETDETELTELKTHLAELETELKNTPFTVNLTPDDKNMIEEVDTIQKELDSRELSLGLDDEKLREQLKLLGERASQVKMTPEYSDFEKATGAPQQDQAALAGKQGTEAQLDALQNLMDFYQELKQTLQELQKEYGKLGPAGQEAFDALGQSVKNVEEKQKALAEQTADVDKKDKKRKKSAKAWGEVGESIGYVGDMLSSVAELSDNSPELNVAAIIAQAIGQVMLGYATASVAAAQTGNPFVWAAFILSGLGIALSTVASIKSATDGYQEGGLIGGRSFTGDKATIHVNSGESVLTNDHMEKVWKWLNSSDNPQAASSASNGGQISWVLKGSDLYGSLKNYGKQQARIGKDIGIK